MHHLAIADTPATNTDALYQYMVDCRFEESHLNAMCLSLAIEHTYKPHPRFWRDFNVKNLLDAVSRLIPDWEAKFCAIAKARMLDDILEVLQMNAFDEANAERLLALPEARRPKDAESAFNWICHEFERAGAHNLLAYARRDGAATGRHALAVIASLSASPDDLPKQRAGMLVARTYREAAMKSSGGRAIDCDNT